MERDIQPFMGYQWYTIEGDVVTVGLSEEGLDEFEKAHSADFPPEEAEVEAEEVCGNIETDEGPLDIYSPVSGNLIEVNPMVLDNPQLIQEDCYGEGWLFRVEAENINDLEVGQYGAEEVE